MATSIARTTIPAKYKPKQGDLMCHNDGTIILCAGVLEFKKGFCGVVVHPGRNCPIGQYSESWDTCIFTLFTGSVTLTQD